MSEGSVVLGREQGSAPTGDVEDRVVITLPAVSAYLSVLRTATAGLAARLDFTLDDIEDLRIAVDEACALLLSDAVPGSELRSRFTLTQGRLEIAVSVLTLGGRVPSRDTFAWTVLTALAGGVDAEADADGRVTVTLSKSRGDDAGGAA